jgi:hypothetical protein
VAKTKLMAGFGIQGLASDAGRLARPRSARGADASNRAVLRLQETYTTMNSYDLSMVGLIRKVVEH